MWTSQNVIKVLKRLQIDTERMFFAFIFFLNIYKSDTLQSIAWVVICTVQNNFKKCNLYLTE